MTDTIPHFLYKYRTVDANSLALLASDKVYLSRLDAFNDPFEVLSLDATLESKLSFDRHGTFAVSNDARQSDSLGKSLRACSLSEECQDLLMWGHYADCHRGFCIRFEFERDAALKELVFPIKYAASNSNDETENPDSIERAIESTLAKSNKWSYEREWRIMGRVPAGESQTADLFATYQPDAITGIIFGVRTPDLHKELIRRILHGRDIEYFQAQKRNRDFALAIRSIA
jgi:hypothetical protein